MQMLQIPLKTLKTPTLSKSTAFPNLLPPFKSMLDLQEHPEATNCKQLCNRAKGRRAQHSQPWNSKQTPSLRGALLWKWRFHNTGNSQRTESEPHSKPPADSHISGAVTQQEQHPGPQEPVTECLTSREGE